MSAVPKRIDKAAQSDWRPGASLDVLKLRATLLARVRAFLANRGVLEVDTPLLSRYATPDPALQSFQTRYLGPGSAQGQRLYLHTSPEYFMKRLLAFGSGSIYQLAHVFRNGELGGRHNPEFMLLEWYCTTKDHFGLMDEIEALLAFVLDGISDCRPARRITYRDWFREHTGLDPGKDGLDQFRRFAQDKLGSVPATMDDNELDTWLDLLITHWIEPRLGKGALFVYDYPVSQAALARVRNDAVPVAERFELYLDGVELANGFHELADADEQAQRLYAENRVREQRGLEPVSIDENFLNALHSGLPDCSGVALGFDRLVMLAAALPDIQSAMVFSFSRA